MVRAVHERHIVHDWAGTVPNAGVPSNAAAESSNATAEPSNATAESSNAVINTVEYPNDSESESFCSGEKE